MLLPWILGLSVLGSLGATFLDMIPTALGQAPARLVTSTVLAGIGTIALLHLGR
jgi:hypothetical protein